MQTGFVANSIVCDLEKLKENTIFVYASVLYTLMNDHWQWRFSSLDGTHRRGIDVNPKL